MIDHAATAGVQPRAVGPIGRLGRFAADHVRAVSVAWAIVAVALAAFAPKAETALSAHEAAIGGLAESGRVIFAAAAVMVAVFFTFALSGALPPKEMGVILGIAVLLDAMLVRLVLVPTLLRGLGRYAWATPRWLGRMLPRVRFGHA